jgi:NAD(P)-dependent dehydrogenase (short-subunit alcohol dehydrogenase family)
MVYRLIDENPDGETVSRGAPFAPGGVAVVFGASGGIGRALTARLRAHPDFSNVSGYSRSGTIPLDLAVESTIEAVAAEVKSRGADVRLLIDATGVLQGEGVVAEKTWRQLDPAAMLRAFAVNAIGPALLMKHFLPLLPREGKSVFATLSARVGSIGDNRLGGWYSYRASKAALNQIVRTAAIELRRSRPEAVCVALHPGTVDTPLSALFAKPGLEIQSPDTAANRIVAVLDTLTSASSGEFFDQRGRAIAW